MAVSSRYGEIALPGIPDNEPVFIIRGRDALAVAVVEAYAAAAYDHGLSEFGAQVPGGIAQDRELAAAKPRHRAAARLGPRSSRSRLQTFRRASPGPDPGRCAIALAPLRRRRRNPRRLCKPHAFALAFPARPCPPQPPPPGPVPVPPPPPVPAPPPLPPPGASVPAPIALQGYELVMTDSFETLDRNRWKRLWYENEVPSSRAFIEDGALKLVSRRSENFPNVDLVTFNRYEGGGRTFRYGYFQVRIRWQAVKGSWPAFWLFSAANSTHYEGSAPPWSSPLASEFDIFEGHGNPEARHDMSHPGRFYFPWALHKNTSGLVGGIADETRGYDWQPVGDTSGSWHTIAGLWTPTHVGVFLDDKPVSPGSVPTFASSDQDMYPLLSLWIGSGGWGDGEEDSSTPDEVAVWYDDFQIWQKP